MIAKDQESHGYNDQEQKNNRNHQQFALLFLSLGSSVTIIVTHCGPPGP